MIRKLARNNESIQTAKQRGTLMYISKKRIVMSLIVVIAMIGISLTIILYTRQRSNSSQTPEGSVGGIRKMLSGEGNKPYTPTRREWLCTLMNTARNVEAGKFEKDMIGVSFVFESHELKPNTIVINVQYTEATSVEVLMKLISIQRELLMTRAKIYGWDKWLKIEEYVKKW